jgi:hypothetical protein
MVLIHYVWALPNTILGLLLVPFVVATRGQVRAVDGVLELHGWLLSCLLRRCVPLPGGASAMTLGHVVLARDERALCTTRRHERVHVRQCELWGPAFIPAYMAAAAWGFITGNGAYAGNYFERQARQREGSRFRVQSLEP